MNGKVMIPFAIVFQTTVGSGQCAYLVFVSGRYTLNSLARGTLRDACWTSSAK